MSRRDKHARMEQTARAAAEGPLAAAVDQLVVGNEISTEHSPIPTGSGRENADIGDSPVGSQAAPSDPIPSAGDGLGGDEQAPAEEGFRCEGCDAVIETGDSVCPVTDGGFLCEACAPTWVDVQQRPEAFDMTAEEAEHEVTAHLAAGGTIDDPYTPETAMTEKDVERLADAIGTMIIEENARESTPQDLEHALDARRYMVAGLEMGVVGRSPSQTAVKYASELQEKMRLDEASILLANGSSVVFATGEVITSKELNAGAYTEVWDEDAWRVYSQLTAPIKAAEAAANAVIDAVKSEFEQFDDDAGLLPDDDLAKYVCGLKAAADFIRQGGSSAEGRVFWNHLALGGFHSWGVNSWDDLPFALRLGWATFGSVIVTYDAFAAADAARCLKPEPQPIHRVPIEETTLDTVDGIMDRFDDRR